MILLKCTRNEIIKSLAFHQLNYYTNFFWFQADPVNR